MVWRQTNRPTNNGLITCYENSINYLSAEQIYSLYPHNFKSDHSGKLRGEPPFRESQSGTSFTVFPDKRFFDAGDGFAGTPADYILSIKVGRWTKALGKDFVDSVKVLAEMANEPFPEFQPKDIKFAQEWERRRALLAEANEYFVKALSSETAQEAKQYLYSRGLSDEAIATLELGYCDSIKNLVEDLKAKGFSRDEIKNSGLNASKLEGYISTLWVDAKNRPLTFYFRYQEKLPPEGKPKTYALHGHSTKSHPLYLNKVLEHRHHEAIFVEGLYDAIILQSLGETRVCSGVAASFSGEQIQALVKEGITKVTHLGDPDGGGDAGTMSNLVRLTNAGIDVYVPERLPDGLDPDEFVIKYGLSAFQERVDKAEHGLRWAAKQLIAAANLATDKGKDDLIWSAKKWINKLKNNVDTAKVETYFWSEISNVLGCSSESFQQSLDSKYKLPNDWNQSSITEYLKEKYMNVLAFDGLSQSWYYYRGKGDWKNISKYVALKLVQEELYRLIPIMETLQPDDKKKRLHFTYNFLESVTKSLQVKLLVEEWKENQTLIPLKNGVFDPVAMVLYPHSPKYHFSWQLPYPYDPLEGCEPIQEWLLEQLGDKDKVEAVRAYMRLIVTGNTSAQAFLEFIGPGGTGKSTIIRLLLALIGVNNSHTTSLAKLEGDKFECANLYGKRLVVISDSERYGGQVSKLKAITGQDPVDYEVKYQQARGGFVPNCLVVVAANEVPQCADYTSGLSRRRRTLVMDKRVHPRRQRNLIEIKNGEVTGEFAKFIPGLLNWVLDMSESEAIARIKDFYAYCPSAEKFQKQVLCDTNPLADWANHCLVWRSESRLNVGVAKRDKDPDSENWFMFVDSWLYASYSEFCHNTGTRPVALRRFSNLTHDLFVNQLGMDVKRGRDSKGAYFLGLAIRTDADDDPLLITGDEIVTVDSPELTAVEQLEMITVLPDIPDEVGDNVEAIINDPEEMEDIAGWLTDGEMIQECLNLFGWRVVKAAAQLSEEIAVRVLEFIRQLSPPNSSFG